MTVQTINDLIRRRTSESPHQAAFFVRQKDRQWISKTWGAFQDQIDQLASALGSQGVQKGDRVAIIGPTCLKWELADKASLLCGAVVVGIDPRTPTEHIAYILRDADAEYLFVEDEIVYERLPADIRVRLRWAIAFETPQASGLVSWDVFSQGVSASSYTTPIVSDDDLAILIYTSGTTGTPRGIAYTHRQVTMGCEAIRAALPRFEPRGRLICWLPLAHLNQRIINLLAALEDQQTYFLQDPRMIIDTIKEVRPTYFMSVPRLFEKVYQAIQAGIASQSNLKKKVMALSLAIGRRASLTMQRKKVPSLWLRFSSALVESLVLKRIREQAFGSQIRLCFTGSAPINREVLEFYHSIGLLILEVYALSENIVPMASNRQDDFQFGSVGKPMAPNEIRIGGDGLIQVRGPGVCKGYWKSATNDPPRNPEGFMETGDHGTFDERGFLFLTGRNSDIIKTSTGRKISLVRIESVYRISPLFDHVVAVGQGRPYLVVLLTLNPSAIDKHLPSDEVRKRVEQELNSLNDALASYERPATFAILEKPLSMELGELTPSLKVRRHIVEERYRDLIERLYQRSANSQ